MGGRWAAKAQIAEIKELEKDAEETVGVLSEAQRDTQGWLSSRFSSRVPNADEG